MRTIILHIGYPKTGTSSIEAFLRDNREPLGRLGFHVPSVGQGKHGAHHAMVDVLTGQPLPPQQTLSEGEIVASLSGASEDTILISSERLTSVLAQPLRAERLLGHLREAGAAIVLVLYVRNQTQLFNSGYSQQVKSFRNMEDFRTHVDLLRSKLGSFGYLAWVERAERLGVELRARPFSERVRKEGVVEDYLRTVGCPDGASFTTPPRINEAVGPFTVEAGRRLQHWAAERFGELTVRQANRCKLALQETISATGIAEPRYCGLDDELAREIEAEFKDSNDSFARSMWGADWQAVFEGDVGQTFVSNDYHDTGVPPAMQELLQSVESTMHLTIEGILKNPRLAIPEEWNRLRA